MLRSQVMEALKLYRNGQLEEVEKILQVDTTNTPQTIEYAIPGPAAYLKEAKYDDTEQSEGVLGDKNSFAGEEEPPEMGETERLELEQIMIKWLQLDDDLQQLTRIKAELNKKRLALSQDLMKFMDAWRVPEIDLNNSQKVVYSIKEIKQGYNKALITELISDLCPPEQSKYLLEQLEARRKITEKPSLQRKKLREVASKK